MGFFEFGSGNAECGIKKNKKPVMHGVQGLLILDFGMRIWDWKSSKFRNCGFRNLGIQSMD
jgi:hypothetical protein